MTNEFYTLELDTLKQLFIDQNQLLTNALLDGAAWDELAQRRKIVTQLTQIIDQRLGNIQKQARTSCLSIVPRTAA